MLDMKRREFITLLGGAAACVAAGGAAQQGERMRRIGVLMGAVANDPEGRPASRRFSRACSNWAGSRAATCGSTSAGPPGNADDIRRYAVELAALTPDVILATGSISMAPLLQATRAVPIVFVQVVDPVGGGFVESLARPGGNATGFTHFEYGLSAKWLELLKQIAPA